YAIRDDLDAAWAAQRVALARGRRPLLLLLDPGGVPLTRHRGAAMATPPFLDLAVGLAAAVRQMHERGVIHKDLKPAHILVEEGGGRVWLTGFGHATSNPREHRASLASDVIEGTFAY